MAFARSQDPSVTTRRGKSRTRFDVEILDHPSNLARAERRHSWWEFRASAKIIIRLSLSLSFSRRSVKFSRSTKAKLFLDCALVRSKGYSRFFQSNITSSHVIEKTITRSLLSTTFRRYFVLNRANAKISLIHSKFRSFDNKFISSTYYFL